MLISIGWSWWILWCMIWCQWSAHVVWHDLLWKATEVMPFVCQLTLYWLEFVHLVNSFPLSIGSLFILAPRACQKSYWHKAYIWACIVCHKLHKTISNIWYFGALWVGKGGEKGKGIPHLIFQSVNSCVYLVIFDKVLQHTYTVHCFCWWPPNLH